MAAGTQTKSTQKNDTSARIGQLKALMAETKAEQIALKEQIDQVLDLTEVLQKQHIETQKQNLEHLTTHDAAQEVKLGEVKAKVENIEQTLEDGFEVEVEMPLADEIEEVKGFFGRVWHRSKIITATMIGLNSDEGTVATVARDTAFFAGGALISANTPLGEVLDFRA